MTNEELEREGYLEVETKPNGRQAALFPYIFTAAIVADFDDFGYRCRYCYHTMREARYALQHWEGEGEPIGWHRALVQGEPIRKMSNGKILTENSNGEMVDQHGNIMVLY